MCPARNSCDNVFCMEDRGNHLEFFMQEQPRVLFDHSELFHREGSPVGHFLAELSMRDLDSRAKVVNKHVQRWDTHGRLVLKWTSFACYGLIERILCP